MFEEIHSLRKRSNEFVKKIDEHKADAIQQNEKLFVGLNQEQLQRSELADGKAITPLYSLPYARKKGYKKPDLHVTGEMYREMDLIVDETKDSWFITSFAKHTKYLFRYGKIFGISPKNIPTASKSAIESLQKLWLVLVQK